MCQKSDTSSTTTTTTELEGACVSSCGVTYWDNSPSYVIKTPGHLLVLP